MNPRTTLILGFLIGFLGNILASAFWMFWGESKMTNIQVIISIAVIVFAIWCIFIAFKDLKQLKPKEQLSSQ